MLDGPAPFGRLARRWVFATLTGDAQLRNLVTGVYQHPAPPEATYPFVTVQEASPFLPSLDVSERVLFATGSLLVQVTGHRCDPEVLVPAAQRVAALLAGVNSAPIPGGGWVLTCRYHQDFDDPDRDYPSLGAVYRLRVEAD